MNWKDAVAIVGVGESQIGRVPGKSSLALHAEAAKAALDDAGMEKREIDGVLTTNALADYHVRHSQAFAEYFGISAEKAALINTEPLGGAASGQALYHAIPSLMTGQTSAVLIVGGDNLLSWSGDSRGQAIRVMSEAVDKEFELPFGSTAVSWFAMVAQRYLHDYGATAEQLAAVNVAARKWACLHPKAQTYGRPMTVEDVMSSPMIADPFRRLHCSLISDGAAAMIVVPAEKARDYKKKPIYVSGTAIAYGIGRGRVHDVFSQAPDVFTPRYGARVASSKAFAMSGVSRDDIDIVYAYDCYPIMTILSVEGLGYCGDGEGAAFVDGGRIEPGGELPVNTHGGLLSYCHTGFGGGLHMFVEAVRQLRQEGGERQVRGAELALIQGLGSQLARFPTTILRG